MSMPCLSLPARCKAKQIVATITTAAAAAAAAAAPAASSRREGWPACNGCGTCEPGSSTWLRHLVYRPRVLCTVWSPDPADRDNGVHMRPVHNYALREALAVLKSRYHVQAAVKSVTERRYATERRYEAIIRAGCAISLDVLVSILVRLLELGNLQPSPTQPSMW